MTMSQVFELRVHRVSQSASSGSHVTIFDATISIITNDLEIQVLSIVKSDDDPMAEQAIDAITRGCERVLQTRGLGAIVEIYHLVIHPVDFKPHQFERCTVDALIELLTTKRMFGNTESIKYSG
jgi:hypothetical protein